ncbi:MAG: hypothetical protein JXL81_10730, partial [Deltaproteobacteria bacterium]|nr:hypothetical protein [Deltaproteobacteria bacterium]
KNFLRRNVIIAFKVILEDKPVGCETITLDIPADSKDDETMETTIPAPCKDKACKVQAQIFDSTVKKYRIENWMSDCP